MAIDEDALYCDFVETYHIMNYKSLPASRAAILASGLGDESRIKKKMRGDKLDPKETLLASLFDVVMRLSYVLCGVEEAPPSLLNELNGIPQKNEKKIRGVQTFDSPDEFNRKLMELREKH